ncbi:MAG: glycyl-radical enzyme activating protein [Actinomycetaceae bacterium]|nr:glycyl-radical enzyme activating protein [Arcanobacterium sp.]MDD7504541.1 glycyl-radical enzyme activating protein [Actinomycetaceae bacterium]MDY6143184.1 glycyl-radical enzyme activating protein [Arcanobacterium sp.]
MKLDPETQAMIFDIQGFSVHDGPGSRTLVFFKGCPLNCYWCCNPESLHMRQEVMYRRSKCDKCHGCIDRKICPFDAISADGPDSFITIDRSKCIHCEEKPCVEGCYHDALALAGKVYTLDELMYKIERDSRYWGDGGGVTVGGGEIAQQYRFVSNFLKRLHEQGIHTAVESSSMGAWDHLKQIYEHVDWAFNDLKHMDPVKHKEATGKSNRQILENLRHIADLAHEGKLRQVIRIPVVVGFNDDNENIDATIDFVKSIGTHEINLLPFHRLGESKYEQLDEVYDARDMRPPSEELMHSIADRIRAAGLKCYVGSDTPF